MKSEYFYCPRCKVQLKKSAAAWVMGEAKNYVALGGEANVTCPACGFTIDARAMIDGKYDRLPLSRSDIAIFIFIAGVIAGVVLLMQFDFGFWTALGVTTIVLAVGAIAWFMFKRSAQKKS